MVAVERSCRWCLVVAGWVVLAAGCSSGSSAPSYDAGQDEGGPEASAPDDSFAWAQSFAAGTGSAIMAMAADATGVVVVGQITSTVTFGDVVLPPPSGSYAGFVARLDVNGDVLWAKATTGSNGEFEAVVIDPVGDVIVGGDDYGDAPTLGLGGVSLAPAVGPGGGVIFKLDPDGNVLWGRLVETTGEVNVESLAVAGGAIFAAGAVVDDATFGAAGAPAIAGCGVGGCVFLAAYDGQGNVQWAEQAPGTPPRGTGVDPREVWLAATDSGLDLAVGGAYSQAGGLSSDVMEMVVNQYDHAGALTWTKVVPGRDPPYVNGLVLDDVGDAYVLGDDTGLQLGAITTTAYPAAFLAKFAPGGELAWATNYPVAGALADSALAWHDGLYTFGNGGVESGGMAIELFDPVSGAYSSEVHCAAAQNLGQEIAASSAGIFVAGYGGPPSVFGTKTLAALGLFVAKLR